MAAVESKAIATASDNNSGRSDAIAPVDVSSEIARRRVRVGVGEGRDRCPADSNPFTAAD